MANSYGADAPRSATPNEGALPSADTLKADAGALADEAKDVLGQINEEAGSQLSQIADQAKEKVSEATDKVKGLAAEQKDLLATHIGGVADAMQRVAADLEGQGGASASYARMIADNAAQLSTTVRDNDVDQIMSKAQAFGRQQPVAFLGAAALLGFAASRFLLASSKRVEQQPAAAGVDSGMSPTSTYDAGRL